MKKTMTLPNGEVIWDHHSGNWDCWAEKYGDWSGVGCYPLVVEITQTGSSFGRKE